MRAKSIEEIREHLTRGGRVYAVLHDASVERVDKVEDERIYAGIWSSDFACLDINYWMLLPIEEETEEEQQASSEEFLSLPIYFDEEEKSGEWTRKVRRKGTIAELLEVWDIDDESETSEMAQVLRHLRNYVRGTK